MSEFSFTAGAAGGHGRIILIPDEHILYDTPILERTPASVPAAFSEKWAENFIAQIDAKLVPGWAQVLESLGTYKTLLVDKATSGYPSFLAPGQVSRHGHSTALSLALHARHLEAAYAKLSLAIDFMTGAGRAAFEARIRDSAPAWKQGEAGPLSVTGDYLERLLGAAVRQWFFLGWTARFPYFKWLSDYTEGALPPDPLFLKDEPRWDVARRHNNLLIQGGCFILRNISVARTHEKLDQFLTDHLSVAYAPPPESFIRFQVVEGIIGIRTLIAFAEA